MILRINVNKLIFVSPAGLEPANPFGHMPLKHACLPNSTTVRDMSLSTNTGVSYPIGGYVGNYRCICDPDQQTHVSPVGFEPTTPTLSR